MVKNYFFFVCLSVLLFSCSSDEPETTGSESFPLWDDILGQWDVVNNEVDAFSGTKLRENYFKVNENDKSFKIFTLVFRENSEFQAVHSEGQYSGTYEILDANSVSLSGLGTLEEVQVSEGAINAALNLNKGARIPFSGKSKKDYKDGDCVSFLDCYGEKYWLRRFVPFPEDQPSLVYYDYLTFRNDVSGVWWKNMVLYREKNCFISNENNLLENTEFTILAHTSKMLIFRKESAGEAFLYKYFIDDKGPWDNLNLQIVNLKTSGVFEYQYVSLEHDEAPVFEDYSECKQEDDRIFVPDDVFEQRLIALGLDDVLDNYVLKSQAEGVTELDLSVPLHSDEDKIQDLTGIEGFINLKKLNVENNALTEVNILTLAELEWLNLNKNQLSSLDCSANKKLYSLKAEGNLITEIDISNNPDLWNLELRNNRLQQIDLSKNPEINDLMLGNNHLTSIDLSHNLKLWDVTLNDNELTSLDLSNHKELWFLGASNNYLTAIDLSGASALQFFSVNNNQLSNIDLTGLSALQEIYADNNNLSNLVFEEKPEMYQIYAENNELTSLDLSSLEHEHLHIRVRNNNLSCIQVTEYHLEDRSYWHMDEGVIVSLNCN